jgi:hypothetical protein
VDDDKGLDAAATTIREGLGKEKNDNNEPKIARRQQALDDSI